VVEGPVSEPGWAALAGELIQARQTVLPKRLAEPGPDPAQWQAIVAAAAAAPDHKQLQPWRLVVVPAAQRGRLAEVFAQALFERDPIVSSQDLEKAREKAHRAPVLALLVVDAAKGDEPDVDWNERVISAGCAVQNMLLMATALGFGSALTSGKALKSAPLRELFGLTADEQALCFVSIGSVAASRPVRPRPAVSAYLSVLGGGDAP
jgi:nitroreductase